MGTKGLGIDHDRTEDRHHAEDPDADGEPTGGPDGDPPDGPLTAPSPTPAAATAATATPAPLTPSAVPSAPPLTAPGPARLTAPATTTPATTPAPAPAARPVTAPTAAPTAAPVTASAAVPAEEWVLAADPRAAAHARTLTTRTLRDWTRRGHLAADPCALDDVILIVDELITNAVVHGRGTVRLRLTLDGAPATPVLLGEITDDHPGLPASVRAGRPAPPPVLDWSEDGRGLLLVDALATDYGAYARPPGKTVWFTRSLEPATRP
ncbi:ATP-binding protein [Actinomadura gamaensis]|uniref:ATP-binding protein n=1 Tax=Actinomadura gamaensis TaxID=1763541 RepID=A0ABV9TVM3_9ACTN